MSTITAQITLGTGHLYHEGIQPDYRIDVHENSRLVLCCYGVEKRRPIHIPRVSWLVSPQFVVEEMILMATVCALRAPNVIEKLNGCIPEDGEFRNVYLLPDELRSELFSDCCRALENSRLKMVISLLEDCTLSLYLNKLAECPVQMEVCAPIFIRSMAGPDRPGLADAGCLELPLKRPGR